MRAIVQRVTSASVRIEGVISAEIGTGLLVLLGVAKDDTPADCAWLAEKIAKLRIFSDEAGQMNRAVTEIDGEILVVSQFTLHARVRKGSRPSFNDAAKPELAVRLYDEFVLLLQTALGQRVQTGRFGALMKVALVNDGPVTIPIDSRSRD